MNVLNMIRNNKGKAIAVAGVAAFIVVGALFGRAVSAEQLAQLAEEMSQ